MADTFPVERLPDCHALSPSTDPPFGSPKKTVGSGTFQGNLHLGDRGQRRQAFSSSRNKVSKMAVTKD